MNKIGYEANLRMAEASYFAPVLRMGKKTKKTGIGSKKRWNGSTYTERKREPFKPRFTPIRKVSKKQRARTKDWQAKFMIYKAKQVEIFGTPYCDMANGFPAVKCWGELEPDHIIPRGRHPKNVNGFWNMQAGCHGHHSLKTTTPGLGDKDFRSGKMIMAAHELDSGT